MKTRRQEHGACMLILYSRFLLYRGLFFIAALMNLANFQILNLLSMQTFAAHQGHGLISLIRDYLSVCIKAGE